MSCSFLVSSCECNATTVWHALLSTRNIQGPLLDVRSYGPVQFQTYVVPVVIWTWWLEGIVVIIGFEAGYFHHSTRFSWVNLVPLISKKKFDNHLESENSDKSQFCLMFEPNMKRQFHTLYLDDAHNLVLICFGCWG